MKQGFSLLELSIVLVIISIVVTGGLSLTTAKIGQDQLENTYDEMVNIQKALQAYVTEFGKLPCPASLTLARTDTLYGRQATDCVDATPPAGITQVEYPAASGKYVRIGGVPFYTLQMPERYLDDSFNNRYYYAVSESFITSATSASVGNIRVTDSAGVSISDEVAYTLFSSGKTHKGAYVAKTGTLSTACVSTEKDGENCNNDGIFTDAPYNDGTVTGQFYDDIILWQTRMQLFGNTGGGGSTSSSTSTSSGGNYPLEIKGLTTTTFTGDATVYTMMDACHTQYPYSWMAKVSNKDYIKPSITAAGWWYPDINFGYFQGTGMYTSMRMYTCTDYTSNSSSQYSQVLTSTSTALSTSLQACNIASPVVCVGIR
jgi:prepilin-type N-terminal cleavage/methylation domain-containing protein